MEALLRLMEQDRGFGIPPGAGLTGEQGAGIMRREISMKKAMVFLVMLGFAATLGAQSLAELARLEKARRNSLGDRKAPVITNLDLLRVMKKPAVEIVVPPSEIAELEEDMGAEEEVADESVEPAAKEPAPVATAPPAGEAAVEVVTPPLEAPAAGPSLEEQLQASEELADLLQTKIAKLKQDYSFQESMVPNYVIERQLTETLERLSRAQAEATRLRREIGLRKP
jgi:hypothetical protein